MKNSIEKTKREIKWILIFFISALFISGLTAFFIETELSFISDLFNGEDKLSLWLKTCYVAVKETNLSYPFLAYGTDWLAYSHIILSILFLGPLVDPVKNKWVIIFGTVACIGIIPVALVAGYVRSIPFFWQLIDISFGIFGCIPLFMVRKRIIYLENI